MVPWIPEISEVPQAPQYPSYLRHTKLPLRHTWGVQVKTPRAEPELAPPRSWSICHHWLLKEIEHILSKWGHAAGPGRSNGSEGSCIWNARFPSLCCVPTITSSGWLPTPPMSRENLCSAVSGGPAQLAKLVPWAGKRLPLEIYKHIWVFELYLKYKTWFRIAIYPLLWTSASKPISENMILSFISDLKAFPVTTVC